MGRELGNIAAADTVWPGVAADEIHEANEADEEGRGSAGAADKGMGDWRSICTRR